LQEYRTQEYRIAYPPSFKCNVLRESLSVESQNIPCAALNRGGAVGNLCISLVATVAALDLTKDDIQDPHPGQPVEGGGDSENWGQAHLQNRDSGKDAIRHLRQVYTVELKISKVYLGSCVQLYALAETPQVPPSRAVGLIYEGAIGQQR
jgi:hypothetical protein